jgi:ABC-2 type transport system ATP-binding protein
MSDASGSALLTFAGVEHRYGDRVVLDGVSIEVREGDVFGLLGPNGSGKSTLLRLVCGTEKLSNGTIRYRGRDVAEQPRAIRARLGVISQSPSLDPHLSAIENLRLAARLHGLTGKALAAAADEALQRAGLSERRDDTVKTFSGGMRRRLDIVRALMHRPDLLVLDEPTTGLDERAFRETWSLLDRQRSGTGLTAVVATHRADEAERCDRLAVIHRGRVVRVATPAELGAEVSADLLTFESADPTALIAALSSELGLTATQRAGEVVLECEEGQRLVPRIFDRLGGGLVTAVSLRKPSLADAFVKLTGSGLDGDAPPSDEAAEAA